MATKRKASKKASKKPARKKVTPSKKAAVRSVARAKATAVPKPKRRSGSPRPGEPTSGSASSSLDPRRAGRLRFNDENESARRRRINDLQGISMRDRADSESIGELLEEGQTLEAEAVAGVEGALDADQGEIRTHQVPEDDVPEEYLDKDR